MSVFNNKIFLIALFVTALVAFCNAEEPSNSSTEIRAETPTQIYGPENAGIALFIGNGGAGPTCVLEKLSEDFITSKQLNIRIAWIQTISRHTLENLKEKIIDVSLTYEETPEISALEQGWASNRNLAFNDHFIIVGPKSNPANIQSSDSAVEAFRKIARSGSFFSRNDASGTNEREKLIWENTGFDPFAIMSDRYVTQTVFPPEALEIADKNGLYTITDRGTLLANYERLNNTAVYIQSGDDLMNRCHVMLQDRPSKLAKEFLEYLLSDRAQMIISNYAGKNKEICIDCCPLFTPAAEDEFIDTKCLEQLGL